MLVIVVLICSFFEGLSHAQDLFYFSKQPESTHVKAGSPVKFECQVSHVDNIIYYWNMNGTRLGNTTRKRQIGSNLYITRTNRFQDMGQYSCIAENVTSGYSIASRSANLEVIWLGSNATVQLQSPFSETEIQKGQEIILRCIVEGNGEIKYDWFRNDEQLFKFKGKRIHVRDSSPTHNGVYRCRASNEAGVVESTKNFALKIPGVSYPNIKILPSDIIAKKGMAVKFDCVFENSDSVQWTFKNEILENGDTREIYKNGTLLLKSISLSEEGFYTCRGFKKIDDLSEKSQSYSAKLRLSYIEELSPLCIDPAPLSSDVLVVREMKPQEIVCFPPKGLPLPKVWWEDDTGRTLSNPDTTSSHLNLESPKADTDAGNYTCYAENLAGRKKFTVRLIIAVSPIVNTDMEFITIDEGESYTFSCPYKGTPYPATTVQWKKDKKYITHSRMIINRMNGTLTLRQSQPSDRGTYICEVNTTGFRPVDSKPFKLNVIEKLKFIPRPVSKRLELGEAAKIPCKAQGSPTPIVRWLKERLPSESFPAHVHDINGTLHFDSIYMSDKGKYICIATSTQGTIKATVDIDVIEIANTLNCRIAPFPIFSLAPKFTVTPQNLTEVMEGYSVMLHCMASGDPVPTIKWDKNGEMNGIDTNRFHVFDNGTLLLRYVNEADNGIYGCTAGNSGGLKREEALLVVKGFDKYSPNENSESDDSMMTKTVTITLSAAAAYMALVIGLMVWCRYRRKKRKEAYLNTSPENILLAKTENGEAALMNGEKQETKEIKRENGRKSDGTETTHSQSSAQSKKSAKCNLYEKLAFSRQNLNDMRLIGHGIFGQVFIAKTENSFSPVIVKSLQNVRNENALIEFKRETDMFYRLSHDNIAKILGLCRDSEPHFMILEYTDWGELKQFLQTTKKERSKLSVSQILDIAKQISIGMEHLSNARFIHKDLAARNCIVGSDFKVKVSLIGLCKDVYASDYSQFRNQLLPLRWQPYEAVFEDDYSTKSDVYSFAALCWELFHQGEPPFFSLPDSVVIEKLQQKELNLKPSKSVPSKISSLLINCASYNPRDRPTFSNIAITLGEVIENLI